MDACVVDLDGLRMQPEVVDFPAFLRPRNWIVSTTDQMWIPLDVVEFLLFPPMSRPLSKWVCMTHLRCTGRHCIVEYYYIAYY